MSRALAVVLLGAYAAFEALRVGVALRPPPPNLEASAPTGYYAAVGLVGAVLFVLSAVAAARAHPWALGMAALAFAAHTALVLGGTWALGRSPDRSADLAAQAWVALARAVPAFALLLAPELGRLFRKQLSRRIEDRHG